MPSTEPGLNATCLISASRSAPIISLVIEAELARVDVERVECDTHSSRNRRLYFSNLGANGSKGTLSAAIIAIYGDIFLQDKNGRC